MKKDHVFIFEEDHRNYKVYCKNTNGNFYTNLWNKEGYHKNICPCCGFNIKK